MVLVIKFVVVTQNLLGSLAGELWGKAKIIKFVFNFKNKIHFVQKMID
jgi:hypothetical protein